ncbi:MAG TPA: hypothetical protein DEO64_12745 [Alcaligenes faecalis]|nr:hypothetical protein [Alcaligenes faecalis]
MTRGYSALTIMRIVINYYMTHVVQSASGVDLERQMGLFLGTPIASPDDQIQLHSAALYWA